MDDMISGISADPVMNVLNAAVDATAMRQRVIANNIANVETPNFKRSDVSFQEQLKSAVQSPSAGLQLSVTNKKHLNGFVPSSGSAFTVTQDTSTTMRNDGNNVDVENEMAQLSKNNILYNTYVQMMVSKMATVKSAIQEGK